MPRDSNGNYSLPSIYLATTGTTILAAQHNGPMEDIQEALTNSLPRNGAAPMTDDMKFVSGKSAVLGRDGAAAMDAVTKQQLDAAAPIGSVVAIIGTAAPAGMLKLNGALISRATYANLWAYAQASGVLQTEALWASTFSGAFSVGDGTTTFRLPDLRGMFLRGYDDGRGVDPGRGIGSYQANQNQSHTHPVNDPTHAHPVADPGHAHSSLLPTNRWNYGGGPDNINGGDLTYAATTSAGTGIYLGYSGTGIYLSAQGGNEARPQNLPVLYCMKY